MEPSFGEEKTLLEIGVTPEIATWSKIKQQKDGDVDTLLLEKFKNGISTDYIVYIKGKQFFCHEQVLKGYSEFFASLPVNIDNVVILPETVVTQKAFKLIYEWMLTENAKVGRANFAEVFSAAIYLRVPELVNQVLFCINSPTYFREVSAFFLYQEYDEFRFPNTDNIIDVMLGKIEKFFLVLVASEDFLKMPADDVAVLLGSDAICPRTESDVLMSCIKWVFYDFNTREQYIPKLIECVRFGLISHHLLIKFKNNAQSVEMETFVNNKVVVELIEKGISFGLVKSLCKPDDFKKEIASLKYVIPDERQWIEDPEWLNDPISENCGEENNKNFLIYLNYLNHKSKHHWQQFKLLSEDDEEK